MKNSKTIVLFFCICLIGFTACKKKEVDPPQKPENINSFSDLKASSSFNWSTYKHLKLNVIGFKALSSEKNILIVSNVEGNNIFFKEYHAMSDSFNTEIKVPSDLAQVRVSFGSINQIYSTSNADIKFDYILN